MHLVSKARGFEYGLILMTGVYSFNDSVDKYKCEPSIRIVVAYYSAYMAKNIHFYLNAYRPYNSKGYL